MHGQWFVIIQDIFCTQYIHVTVKLLLNAPLFYSTRKNVYITINKKKSVWANLTKSLLIQYFVSILIAVTGIWLAPLPPPQPVDPRCKNPSLLKIPVRCLHWVCKKNTLSTLGMFKRFFFVFLASSAHFYISLGVLLMSESSINLYNYSVNSSITFILIMNSISWDPQ